MKPLNIKIINNETFYPLYEFEGKYFINELGNKIYSLFLQQVVKGPRKRRLLLCKHNVKRNSKEKIFA